MTRAEYRAQVAQLRLRAHALREHAANPYLQLTRHRYIQSELEREAAMAWWTLPRGDCDRERVEVERVRNRRARVLELLRNRQYSYAQAALHDSMEMFRARPIQRARMLPEARP